MVTKRDSRNGKDSFQQVEIKTRTDLRKKRRGRTKTRAAVGEKERRVEIRRESATVGGGGGGDQPKEEGEKSKKTQDEKRLQEETVPRSLTGVAMVSPAMQPLCQTVLSIFI